MYAADQAVSRSGPTADFDPAWHRTFRFLVPVRDPDFWNAAEVRELLAAALGFLSDDDDRFEFRRLAADRPLPQYIPFGGTAFDGVVDEVAMFSGGLDSLGGAVRAARAGRKVLLVNHRPTQKVSRRLAGLHADLSALGGPAAPVLLPVRVNKDGPLGGEFTRRTRSFLFAALGGTFAAMTGLDRLAFYENGVVSLNLPLSSEIVGGRASRTTHPRVLRGYAALLSRVAGRPVAVKNPFQ